MPEAAALPLSDELFARLAEGVLLRLAGTTAMAPSPRATTMTAQDYRTHDGRNCSSRQGRWQESLLFATLRTRP